MVQLGRMAELSIIRSLLALRVNEGFSFWRNAGAAVIVVFIVARGVVDQVKSLTQSYLFTIFKFQVLEALLN